MKKQPLWIMATLVVALAGCGVFLLSRPVWAPIQPVELVASLPEEPAFSPVPSLAPLLKFIVEDVPFTAQAPLNQWGDGRFQDACEEAAILMAMKWVRGEALGTPAKVSQELIALVNFEKERYGEYRDGSMADTARLLREYYSYEDSSYRENVTLADIRLALMKGALVITPMNGRAMDNPYFVPPGPERHMVLIKGYDPATKQFITNDAGTQNGKDYRYNEEVFFKAIRDYSTGHHVPIVGDAKTMLVVRR